MNLAEAEDSKRMRFFGALRPRPYQSVLECLSNAVRTIAFTALIKSRRELIAQASSKRTALKAASSMASKAVASDLMPNQRSVLRRADGMLSRIGGRDDSALSVCHDRLCRMQTLVDRLHAGNRIEYLPIVFSQNRENYRRRQPILAFACLAYWSGQKAASDASNGAWLNHIDF